MLGFILFTLISLMAIGVAVGFVWLVFNWHKVLKSLEWFLYELKDLIR